MRRDQTCSFHWELQLSITLEVSVRRLDALGTLEDSKGNFEYVESSHQGIGLVSKVPDSLVSSFYALDTQWTLGESTLQALHNVAEASRSSFKSSRRGCREIFARVARAQFDESCLNCAKLCYINCLSTTTWDVTGGFDRLFLP